MRAQIDTRQGVARSNEEEGRKRERDRDQVSALAGAETGRGAKSVGRP